MKNSKQVKDIVKKSYKNIAASSSKCSCSNKKQQRQSGEMGYSENEMNQAPKGSNLGLGCGNPIAIASLRSEDYVLDLGSGAGFDAFLAAKKVGKKGKVIGIDMTDEMLIKARDNAKNGNYSNVEFKKGDIEALPMKNDEVDVIISNCVINLAPNKEKVFKEMYRVLKADGKIMVSDVVLTKPLPEKIKNDKELLSGCVSGAILKKEYIQIIKNVGFKNIKIHKEVEGFLKDYTVSITYSANK